MDETRIVLSGLWVALMPTYLLGDVLRIFAGDFTPGEVSGQRIPQMGWLGIALIMVIPIVMLVLSLVLTYPAVRWVTLSAAVFLIVFNPAGPPYPSAFDNFLIVVGLAIAALKIWCAWTWQPLAP